MIITDSQVHIWSEDAPTRPWPPGGASYAHKSSPFTAEMLLDEMQHASVDRAILVPPSFAGDSNDTCLDAARRYPDRFAVMGRLELDKPIGPDALLEYTRGAGLLGLRLTFTRGPARGWLSEGVGDWLWPLAEEAGIPVMVHAPGQLPAVLAIAEQWSSLGLVIDHLGVTPRMNSDEISETLSAIVSAAVYENVAVKASALPSITNESFPFASLREPIKRVIDSFGPERVFWGSDLTRLSCSYSDCVKHFTEGLDFLSTQELDLVMGTALQNWLGWID